MAIKHAEKADLRPLNRQVLLAFRLKYVEDDRNTVLVVVTNDTLISIGSIALDHTTLLLRGLCRLMILQEKRLRVQHRWVLPEK